MNLTGEIDLIYGRELIAPISEVCFSINYDIYDTIFLIIFVQLFTINAWSSIKINTLKFWILHQDKCYIKTFKNYIIHSLKILEVRIIGLTKN